MGDRMMRRLTVAVCVLFAFGMAICALAADDTAREEEIPADNQTKKKQRDKEPDTLREKLSARVNIVLADMEVATAVTTLNELTHANIVLDARALAEIETRGQPRINVRLEDVPLETALNVILRTVGLDCAVYEHFVYVSTPERIRHESRGPLKTAVFPLKRAAARSLPKTIVRNPPAGPFPVR